MKRLAIFLSVLLIILGISSLISGQYPTKAPYDKVSRDFTFLKDVTILGSLTISGALSLAEPLILTESGGDTFTIDLDGTDTYFKHSDGTFIFLTDEGTNTATEVNIKPKGTSEISKLALYDTDGERLSLFTLADRSYIESSGVTLGIN